MTTDLQEAFLAVGPDSPIPDQMIADDAPEAFADDPPPVVDAVDLMGLDDWQAQWVFLHYGADMVIEGKTGADAGLGELAAKPNGLKAGEAAYRLAARNPRIARLILSKEGSIWGDAVAVLAHVWACKSAITAAMYRPPAVA